ncbi:hypothetical protein OF377_00090 [Ureaplasma sp. ES3154-GEN]|uniref:hypothetical protein n=1 Tax=Ureaplasma sp. ES3154-GEN TaxID=2984844 RepID=UPI0021E7E61C|nr:hypothetical protein [Ureaplasma sp. ES3154-GEN]MCV3743287.1 hypothetical protein [Ureaplasma sp. ES3154-GEN]
MKEKDPKIIYKKNKHKVITGAILGSLTTAGIVIAATQFQGYHHKSSKESEILYKTFDDLNKQFNNLQIQNNSQYETQKLQKGLKEQINLEINPNIITKAQEYLKNNKKLIDGLKLVNDFKSNNFDRLNKDQKSIFLKQYQQLINDLANPNKDQNYVFATLVSFLNDLKNPKQSVSKNSKELFDLINKFDIIKQQAEEYDQKIGDNPEFNDLAINLKNAISNYNAIVHNNPDVSVIDVIQATNDLKLVLTETNYKKTFAI